MKLRTLSTLLFLAISISLLTIPSSRIDAQLGCNTIVYNVPIIDTIDGQFWGRSYCFSGNAGDVLTITMTATASDNLDTYLELSDGNGAVLATNDDADKSSSNSLIQFTLPTTGEYAVYAGRYGKDTGKTFGGYTLTLASPTNGTAQPGRPTSNTTNNTNTPPTRTEVCNNVALNMDFLGASFNLQSNQPTALLDDTANTGWASDGTTNELWFDVVLNGTQTVTSVEFNGFAASGDTSNSIQSFTISRWNANSETFDTILDSAKALNQPGYQKFTLPAVSTDSLTFFLSTNYGGAKFEVADIKVCTSTANTGSTTGRPTTNTTTQSQPPVVDLVPCTIQATSSQAKTAEARLGIGGGRAVAGFLEPGTIYDVIGTNVNDDDGTRWWSVDKTDVVSAKKAINIKEDWLWVADAQTTESGNCDSVEIGADSRIIRAPRPAPQPSTGTSSGGNTNVPPQPPPPEGSTDPFVSFYTDFGTYLLQGECITLKWDVLNVKEIYFFDADTGQEKGVTGPSGSQEICPSSYTQTTTLTYELRVVPLTGADIFRHIEVTVDGGTTCTPYTLTLDSGTLAEFTAQEYILYVEPCGGSVTVYIDAIKDSGDMDPYLDVYENGKNHQDDKSGFENDAFLFFTITKPTELLAYVTNIEAGNGGEYTFSVYIE